MHVYDSEIEVPVFWSKKSVIIRLSGRMSLLVTVVLVISGSTLLYLR